MDNYKKDFLKDVYKDVGAHIRATDRKSLFVTGIYIGLFSVFLSSLARTCISGSPINFSWLSVAIQLFFLIIGTFVYVMQQWYRAWKEHYLDVCLRIRQKIINENDIGNIEKALPYWMRGEVPESRISIDNLLKYLTVTINLIIVVLISYEIFELHQNRSLSILLVVLLIFIYIGVIAITQNRIKRNYLLKSLRIA